MLAILDHMVDNSPISIEKKYVDANGDCDPHRIPVKHNHLEDFRRVGRREAQLACMGGRPI